MNRIFKCTICLAALLQACNESPKQPSQTLDTPTRGRIRMMVDEGYQPLIASVIDVFDTIYVDADIDAIYTSEGEAMKALVKDSIQVVVVTRKPTNDELVYFKNRGFTPKITPVGHDAIAFILNPANKDTVLTVAQLRDILSGKATKWSQINPRSGLGDIRLVFDNPLSGTVRYCRDTIAGGAALPPNAAALKTNAEVISYVSKQKNAIGIIGANWISDTDDKGVQAFRREIKLLDVAQEPGAEGFGPYQAYLATGQYPFRRTIYVINAQARAGLGLGFASFIASDPGQRIIMKEGLLAANVPIRLVKVTR